ncbi:DNA phosphorothioation-dependent restriction protein DptF [Methylomonas sp. EbB]|uniref:DNA phosphorothioation-dependent restriction protein DptF n=1 Tax=Methylomonas fluvii TaxID=1854564 RepID=A0ABR9DGQ8_9GAMM|nr:DNA phosphorothioation-dependent restriction protein DptF [Methylomonas fluvii]
MELHRLINKLSKSSPNAVFTQANDHTSLDTIDQYLYVETKIERDYRKILEEFSGSKRVIFLCGSSGDGKSAIIGRNQQQFKKIYDFHIDATHSFKPNQSAVDALNDRFFSFKQGSKPLVVGINIGILLNFAREGSDDHEDIRQAIRDYITNSTSSDSVMFINFEDYSKFEMKHDNITSSFIHQLFDKVTAPDDSNPFYKAFQDDQQSGALDIEHQNFQLLRFEAVKKSIVELLVTVHLKYDQFLTTRSLLDFLYTLLAGPKLLVHSLFEDCSNAIVENIRKEDPCLLRTAKLDTFILESKINKTDQALNAFIDDFNGQFSQPILSLDDPHLLVRIFYLLEMIPVGLTIINIFKKSFMIKQHMISLNFSMRTSNIKINLF